MVPQDSIEKLLIAADTEYDTSSVHPINYITQYQDTDVVGVRPLEGVLSGYGSILSSAEGHDLCNGSSTLCMPEHPGADSLEHLCDMIEVYWRSLLRDVPFARYGDASKDEDSARIKLAVAELNKCHLAGAYKGPIESARGRITPKALFRGTGVGELEGPLISQLLYHDVFQGAKRVNQQYVVLNDSDTSILRADWLKIQNGIEEREPMSSMKDLRNSYAYNGRVLGSLVRRDAVYQYYYNAVNIIHSMKVWELGTALTTLDTLWAPSESDDEKSSPWTDGGFPDLLVNTANACLGALRAAWWNKWQEYNVIRPEVCNETRSNQDV